MSVELTITRDDVTNVASNLLLLKYARSFHGADEAVAVRLVQRRVCDEKDISPDDGDFAIVETDGAVAAERVLFIGTPWLREFRYAEMRRFARRAIELIAEQRLPVRTLTTTVHGAGYGLDISESLQAMVLGFQQGLASAHVPDFEKIVFVERNARRFNVLNELLKDMELIGSNSTPAALPDLPEVPRYEESAVSPAETKKRVFVAMPFQEDFEDVYQFGIYSVIRSLGYVCERVDESIFAGNIVERIIEGIRGAEFVVADLTNERPNVYLEVGFAWGLDRPVILVAREGQSLHFDVSHHRCIFYRTIGRLAEELKRTIDDLFGPNNSTTD